MEIDRLGHTDNFEKGNETGNSSTFLRTTKQEDVSEEDIMLEVSMRFSRGLSATHSSLIGDVADPSLQDGLRMREYTLKAQERIAGTARFQSSDKTRKEERQKWVHQAKKARGENIKEEDLDNRPRTEKGVVHLGTLEQEKGGGIAEESQDIVNADGTHANFDHELSQQSQQWEDEGASEAERQEEQEAEVSWLQRQKANLKNDRMAERGVYQTKIARSGQW